MPLKRGLEKARFVLDKETKFLKWQSPITISSNNALTLEDKDELDGLVECGRIVCSQLNRPSNLSSIGLT